ncbi:MAG: hypothetical protein V4590_00830, partial [Bacteroidota bacterium]
KSDSAAFSAKSAWAKLADSTAFAKKTDSATFSSKAAWAKLADSTVFAKKADTAKICITHIYDTIITTTYADTAKYASDINKGALIYDKQIRFKVGDGISTSSTSYSLVSKLIKFRKTDFIGVDSLIFVASPYTSGGGNFAEVELYNFTDNVVVSNSILSSNTNSASALSLQTGNLFNNIPDKEITLGIRCRSTVNGQFASAGFEQWIFLYRR